MAGLPSLVSTLQNVHRPRCYVASGDWSYERGPYAAKHLAPSLWSVQADLCAGGFVCRLIFVRVRTLRLHACESLTCVDACESLRGGLVLRVVASHLMSKFVGWRSMKEQLNNRKVSQQVTDRCCVCVMQSVSEFWL